MSEYFAATNPMTQQFQRLVSLVKFGNFGTSLLIFRGTAHPLAYFLPAFFFFQAL